MVTMTSAKKKFQELAKRRDGLQKEQDQQTKVDRSLDEVDQDLEAQGKVIYDLQRKEAVVSLAVLRKREASLFADFEQVLTQLEDIQEAADSLRGKIVTLTGPYRGDEAMGGGDVDILSRLGYVAYQWRLQGQEFVKMIQHRAKSLGYG